MFIYTCTPTNNPARFASKSTVWGSNIPLTGYGQYIWRVEVTFDPKMETHYAMRCNHLSTGWGQLVVDGIIQYSFTADLIIGWQLVSVGEGIESDLTYDQTLEVSQEEWQWRPHQYSLWHKEVSYSTTRVEKQIMLRDELSEHKMLNPLCIEWIEPDLHGGWLGYICVRSDLPEAGYACAVSI